MDYNTKKYMSTINTDYDYKITISEFSRWLEEHNEDEFFLKKIRSWLIEDDIDYLYAVAWDFTIPIIMVKWFALRLNFKR